ncbi:GspH/FimT family pseudopilin [Noviherbaspirillum sp. ST9]|uniref:GspH/FimT family pseudopilin n=1 Tax=Noviherbaspirillum sp. ST9 TaxID=3401606 RepID=UPI003B589F88
MKRRSPFLLRSSRGFTLIELAVTLSVAAILFTAAVPSFVSLIRNTQITATTNDFFAAINLARAEAVQRGIRVDMVPAGEEGDWAQGWVVFIDKNRDQRAGDKDVIIFRHGPAPKGMHITARLTDSTVQYLAYNGAGRTRTHDNGYRTQFGTFTFELESKVRKIKLNFIGRPRICNPEIDTDTC